ncbi:MAG: DUF5916 domain-containing protein [Bacteroidota bacterium]
MPYFSYFSWLLLVFLLPLSTIAQDQRPNQETHQLSIQRLPEGAKIVLDGLLDEAVWQTTDVATNFWEKDPRDGVQAERPTEARLTYDDQFLYVAIKCFDEDAGHIISTLKRDVGYWQGDAVAILLDPVNEATNGFMFGVSPAGVQTEALLGGGSGDGNYNGNWDNIWYAEAATHTDHWAVEMAIPFKTLRFEAGSTTWGLNFLRNDTQHNQFHVWAPVPRQFWGIDLGYAGQLRWDVAPPVANGNVALIPYALGAVGEDFEENTNLENLQTGADAKIALSPSLNLDLTVNPDFSQVDVDVQVTNLTRFSIFFPERRNFFLENSDLFSNFGIPPLRPFFSRRIGLDEDGQPVPILFGARLTGNATENLRIGLMNVQTRANENQAAQNYLTAAFNQRIFQRSSISGMFINRQAFTDGSLSNTDYTRNADLELNLQSADGTWEGWAGYHQSLRKNINNANAYWNAGGAYTGANMNFVFDYVSVGENYFADVGFVNRIDNYDAVRDTTIREGYKILWSPLRFTLLPKADWIQNLNFEFINALFLRPDHSIKDRETFFLLNPVFPNSANIRGGVGNLSTLLLYPFEFTDGEPLPAGRYNYTDFGINFFSDDRERFSYVLNFEGGQFYNGQRRLIGGNLNYRAQPWGNFAISAQYNSLDLPEPYGDSELWLVGPRFEINFSRNLFWTTFVQYNTQADNFNINSRLQWQFRPLSWIFLVYTDNYATEIWGPKNRGIVLKANYWLVL